MSDSSDMRGVRPASDIVGFVCLARGLGGSTRSLATVLSYLPSHLHRVLIGPSPSAFAEYLQERRLIESHIEIPGRRKGKANRVARPVAAARVAAWTVKHRARIVALHANGPEELNLVAPASVITRVPVVVWSHARGVSPWMNRLVPLWQRVLPGIRWAAVSSTARRVLVDAGVADESRIAIVPNPIDPIDVEATGDPKVSDGSGRVVVGYLGSDATYKGFQMLPAVINRLSRLPIEWRVFSDRGKSNPTTWEQLRALPPTLVSFPGKLPDVKRAYSQCDIVFCPSLEESFGRVVAEAMLNGLPVVASDLDAVRELVDGDKAGLLFPPGDVEAAALTVKLLVEDQPFRRRLGVHGRERAQAYHPRHVVDQLTRLYGLSQPTRDTT